MIKSTDFNSDVIIEPCISFERTTVYPQVRKVWMINFFTIFGTKPFVWPSMARGSGEKLSVEVAQLSILNMNQRRSIVGLSAIALAIAVHSERSDSTGIFPWQLIWLITDTCHNESVWLAEGHRMIKTARRGWKEAFLRWKVVELRTCSTFREIWEEKGIWSRVVELLLLNLQVRENNGE